VARRFRSFAHASAGRTSALGHSWRHPFLLRISFFLSFFLSFSFSGIIAQVTRMQRKREQETSFYQQG